MKLSDIGEIKFLSQYIFPKMNLSKEDINNDCVSIPANSNNKLIWTIDPLPTPIAAYLGYKDPKILGWYTALINFSDIAANGGKPIGILVSVECPNNTEVDFYLRYSEGLTALCKKYGASLMGGNLRTNDKFTVTATTIGEVVGQRLTRSGIAPGHKIFVVGKSGFFWAAVLVEMGFVKAPASYEKILKNALCYPLPQIEAGKILSNLSFPVACMDSSDGILNCCYQFSTINKVNIMLYEQNWKVPSEITEIYKLQNISIDNACYNWGEWQLVCAVAPENAVELKKKLDEKDIQLTEIGYALDAEGEPNVYSAKSNKILNRNLLNERFTNELYYKNLTSIIKDFLYQEIFI